MKQMILSIAIYICAADAVCPSFPGRHGGAHLFGIPPFSALLVLAPAVVFAIAYIRWFYSPDAGRKRTMSAVVLNSIAAAALSAYLLLVPAPGSSGVAQTVALSPTPISHIEITPSVAVVTVGSPWRLSVWNEAGQLLTDAVWSLSSTDLAEIVPAETDRGVQPEAGERSQHRSRWVLERSRSGSLMLLAKAPGRLTVTARWKNAVAQAEIEIVSGLASEGGTLRWVVPAHPGFSTICFREAVPSSGNTPAFYAVENGGARGLWVRGLDFEGAQMWAYRWTEPIGAASLQDSPTAAHSAGLRPGDKAFIGVVPDDWGGLVLQFEDAHSRSLLVGLDGRTGKEGWRYDSPGWLYPTSTQNATGTMYIVEIQNQPRPEAELIGIDTRSGLVKTRFSLPPSRSGEKNIGCKEGNDRIVESAASTGAPMTSEHGSVFVEVEVSSMIHDALPCGRGGTLSIDNSLRLLEVKEDGSHEWRTIKQFTYHGPANEPEAGSVPRPFASEVIPDGRGGVQAAWTYSAQSPTPKLEARITRVSPSEMKEFTLPFPGWGDPSGAHMVLGEQTTGMAAMGNQVVAYDVVTGAVKWTWHSEQGRAQILMSLAGNGLLIMNRGEVVQFDANGRLTQQSQEVLSRRYRAGSAPEDGDDDQIDADGETAFWYDFGMFFAIQTPRPHRPSAVIATAVGWHHQ